MDGQDGFFDFDGDSGEGSDGDESFSEDFTLDYDFDLDDDFDLDSVLDTFVEKCVVDLMNEYELEGSEFEMDWGDEDSDESIFNSEEESPYEASDKIY
jgi:hypothetical protein